MAELEMGGTCKRGHSITAETSEWVITKSRKMRLACVQCTLECRRGHLRTESNTRVDGRTGTRICRDCAKERSKSRVRASSSSQKQTREQMREYDAAYRSLKARHASIVEQGDEKGNVSGVFRYEYLVPKGLALEALTKLNRELDETRTPCFDKPEAYADWDEDDPPTNEEAKLMCAGCPVARLCEDYGRKSRDRGVWGGTVILDNGRIQR